MLRAGIAALKENSHLTRLNVAVCREVSDEGVAAVAGLSKLQTLDLTFCDRITDAGVSHLSRSVFCLWLGPFQHAGLCNTATCLLV